MSYPRELDDPGKIHELLRKKEYAMLSPMNQKIITPMDHDMRKQNKFQLRSYQRFVNNLISPNTPYDRLLVKHDTGTGKTVTVISTAMAFVDYFYANFKLFENNDTEDHIPSCFIIGFSKHIFYKEFLRRPEFGYVSREEVAENQRLQSIAAQSGLKSDRDAATEYYSMLKKRLSKRTRRGMFKFYGYKEFFNRLFIFSEEGISSLSKEFKTQLDKSNLSEEQLLQGIKLGYVKINYELIDKLVNGFIICDEIHNVYNSIEINNYGLAIRIALMIHENPDYMSEWVNMNGTNAYNKPRLETLRNSRIRIIFLSATPLNNSPTEIIDLINLWIPLKRIRSVTGKYKIEKSDFFKDSRNLQPNARAQLKKLIRGYVSFLSDTNPEYFPSSSFEGEIQKIPTKFLSQRVQTYTGKTIPYLKFVKCPMSSLHRATYNKVFQGTLPPDGQSLLDIVLPNPLDAKIGLFKTKDIKFQIPSASASWKNKNKIDVVKQSIGSQEVDVITGEFMRLPELKKYSNKYAILMQYAIENLKKQGGKVIINHQQVKMSGVLFIAEVLRINGIIDEFAEPNNNTLCVHCGNTMAQTHIKHEFYPARFIIFHGDIDKTTQDRNLSKFNATNNMHGDNIRFLIGSKIINEGIDFRDVRELWVAKVPDNIPTLQQIKGRAIRAWSHIQLAPELRHVNVRIFVSTLDNPNDISYEMRRYFEKSQDYLVIQNLEKDINEEAIDGPLNRSTIFPTEESDTQLGKLYYKLPNPIRLDPNNITDSTFKAFHTDKEIEFVVYMIKRLFIETSQVWSYDELWKAIQNPPFSMPLRADMINEKNFALALHKMLAYDESNDSQIDIYQNDSINIDRIFDSSYTSIHIDGSECKITYINGLYILFPIRDTRSSKTTNDEKRLQIILGKNVSDVSGIPDVDIENWYRYAESTANTSVNITKYLQTSSVSYNHLKLRFYKKYQKSLLQDIPTSIEIFGIDFHIRLIQDCIKYVFLVLTNPTMPFSELHNFYFKMLYFYDKLNLILFANQITGTSLESKFAPYVTKGTLRRKTKLEESIIKDEKHNAFLMKSILHTVGLSKPFEMNTLNAFLGKSKTPQALAVKPKNVGLDNIVVDFSKWNVQDTKKINKVYADMLPVGHFIRSERTQISTNYIVPTVLIDGNWVDATEFSKPLPYEVENDLIIGYYDQNISGIDLKFKLRVPKQKLVKYDDSRLIERGSACNTRKKDDLISIAKMLKIKPNGSSIRNLCDSIKIELMKREMMERRNVKAAERSGKKYKKIRWFYLHFEIQQLDI